MMIPIWSVFVWIPVCMRVDRDDCDWLYSYSIFINSNHPQHLILYRIIMIWIWIVCRLLLSLINISCFLHHSIPYFIDTLYQHLLFTQHTQLLALSLRDDIVMNGNKRDCVESEWYVRSLLINLMWRMRLSDELFRLLKCMKHCETIWKRYCL